MKTLQRHTLIYDRDCPMCNLYSKAFIQFGFLDNNGREAFAEIKQQTSDLLDFERAKNEIALVDYKNKNVIYGLDSLLLILGNSRPILEKIGRIKPVYWFFSKLYSFISYNRKVIFPTASQHQVNACVPAFNLKYRLLYILFILLFSVYILGLYTSKIQELDSGLRPALFLVTMLLIWQSVFLGIYLKEKYWEYVGNLMTVLLLGSLALIPALIFNSNNSNSLYYFTLVLVLMVLEHVRRSRILKVGRASVSLATFIITFGSVFFYIITKN